MQLDSCVIGRCHYKLVINHYTWSLFLRSEVLTQIILMFKIHLMNIHSYNYDIEVL